MFCTVSLLGTEVDSKGFSPHPSNGHLLCRKNRDGCADQTSLSCPSPVLCESIRTNAKEHVLSIKGYNMPSCNPNECEFLLHSLVPHDHENCKL